MLRLTRWDPFEELDNFHRAFSGRWTAVPAERDLPWVPAMEVTSDKEGWTIRIALPGIDPKNVKVDLHDSVLTVAGERSGEVEDVDHHVSEFGYGAFERSFTLPSSVDSEKVDAVFQHGMLELRLPIVEASKPRRIEIDGGASKAA
jgi:HSP20 family protein